HPLASALIMKAISKSPDDRFQTCQALLDELEKCKQSNTIAAKKPEAAKPAAKPPVAAKPATPGFAGKPSAPAAKPAAPAPRPQMPAAATTAKPVAPPKAAVPAFEL